MLITATIFDFAFLQADTYGETRSTNAIPTSWRLTRFGWQDSTSWFVDSFAPIKTVELIHPLVWTALVLVTVLLVMIWASEEWDLARLFSSKVDGTAGKNRQTGSGNHFEGPVSAPANPETTGSKPVSIDDEFDPRPITR